MTTTTTRGEKIDLNAIDITMLNTPVVAVDEFGEAWGYCTLVEFLNVTATSAKESVAQLQECIEDEYFTLENLQSILDVYIWNDKFEVYEANVCNVCSKVIA